MAKKKKKHGKKAAHKKRKTAKKAHKSHSGLTPVNVIAGRARALKRNKRAADIYRDVLKCH